MIKINASHKGNKWFVKFLDQETNDVQTFTFIYIKKDREIFLKNLTTFGSIINGKSLKKGMSIRRYFWTRYI